MAFELATVGENHSQGPHGDTGLKEMMEVGLQESEDLWVLKA